MKSIFLNDGELARVKLGPPFSGKADGEPRLDLNFHTTPGHQSGAEMSLDTALELVARIVLRMEEIGFPVSKPCATCGQGEFNEPTIDKVTGALLWWCVEHAPAETGARGQA